MRFLNLTSLFALLMLASCSQQTSKFPTIPDLVMFHVGVGSRVSKDITDREKCALLKEFISRGSHQWKEQTKIHTPTRGDVAVVVYSETGRHELVELGEHILIYGDFITRLSPDEVEEILEIIELTRDEAFLFRIKARKLKNTNKLRDQIAGTGDATD